MTFTLDDLHRSEIDVRVYGGDPPRGAIIPEGLRNSSRWGVHAKRAVVDRKHVVIGTYNVDPRSANLNSELMLICRNQPALAEEMLYDINSRMERSRKLFGAGKPALHSLLEGATIGQRIRYVLALPLANMFDFLL